ncbi:MAG: Ig-like domain-containing protein, partial [bacterium]
MRVVGVKILKSWLVVLLTLSVTACGVPENSIEVKTAREAAAANCDQTGKCVKDPSGLVLYNSDLVTEDFVLKRQDENQTLLTKLFNLIDEPKLLVTADKLEPLMRGVAIVGEFEPCDSPKGIDGSNPTMGQLRSLKQGRYKACITYIGDGLFKKAFALSPIDVDTTPPEVAKTGVYNPAVTSTTASLTWSKGGDNLTLDGKLIYAVYTSKTNVLDSLEAVRTHGNLVPGLLIGGISYTITSLSENTNYHAAVVVTDEAGNQSLVGHSNFRTTTSDTNPSDKNPPTSPSVVININDSYTNTTAATLTLGAVDASEMYVTNADGCTSGGTWEPYDTSKSWTLAQTNATATVYAKFRDLAGNETGCVNDTIFHDDTAPLAPVISDASRSFNASFTPSIQQNIVSDSNFKEIRYTLTGTDPTCSTGTASATVPTSVIIPASTTTLKAISCDEAGQASAISSATYTYDNTSPTISITTSATSSTKISPIPVTFTFSKVVTGFNVSDIVVGNGTAGDFTGSGTTYTANIIPAGQGAITVDVDANKAQDAANNGNTAASQLSITYDNDAPTVTITSNRDPGPTNNASILLTFTFSEAVTGFDATDVSVNNATKGTFTATSSTFYTLAITPTGSAVSASVASNSATDSAANGNLASTPWSITYDNSAPTVAITSNRDPGPTNNSNILLTFTFSEDMTGFDVADISVTNATKGTFSATNSSTYTLAITPTDSAVSASVASNSAVDSAANGNLASTPWSITYDNSPPTAVFASNRDPGPTNSSSITLTLTFSEPVSGVFFGDFAVNGGTLSAFTAISSSVYTVLVTPSAASVAVLYQGNPFDDAGSEWEGGRIWRIKYDNTAPVSPVIDASKSFNAAFDADVQQGIPVDANFKE